MRHPLDERISEIRDLINKPRKQNVLMQNSAMWLMLCSCMDTIQDTEEALESYLTKDDDNDNSGSGHKYLLVYGALQALFIQQEAVKNLHESLDISYTEDSSLREIREIHRDAVGSPTKRRDREAFNFINRSTLTIRGFRLAIEYPKKSNDKKRDTKRIDVDIPNLIEAQRNNLKTVLNGVIKTLQKEEAEHKRKFANKSLASAFYHTTYPFEKIFDAITSKDSPHGEIIDSHVDGVLKGVEDFRTRLKERGEPDDNISDIYENLDHSLQQIKVYFRNPSESNITENDLYIFAYFARRQVTELEAIARELDEMYSQQGIQID